MSISKARALSSKKDILPQGSKVVVPKVHKQSLPASALKVPSIAPKLVAGTSQHSGPGSSKQIGGHGNSKLLPETFNPLGEQDHSEPGPPICKLNASSKEKPQGKGLLYFLSFNLSIAVLQLVNFDYCSFSPYW